ncbi:MAG: hypothetical protein KatS3mg119_1344 [Rhodothalassiaceae bacterium]|nr:MAG: hypothetical protein KatS3mg119_1344 [Rhodothalassiaceae bacterium]
MAAKDPARMERLKAALRANLRRRKAQMRARAGTPDAAHGAAPAGSRPGRPADEAQDREEADRCP